MKLNDLLDKINKDKFRMGLVIYTHEGEIFTIDHFSHDFYKRFCSAEKEQKLVNLSEIDGLKERDLSIESITSEWYDFDFLAIHTTK